MMRRASNNRASFTLIELLVVIAIIVILAALTTSAVMMALRNIENVRTRNDINGLSTSLAAFHKDFRKYPPGRFLLSPNVGDYSTPGIGQESKAALQQLFPSMDLTAVCVTLLNSGMTAGVMLEGDQCLVFFLQGPAGNGFSGDAKNPFNNAVGKRRGPYFEFPPARLKAFHPGNNFPSFEDGYLIGKPYLYFSSNSRANGYHKPNPLALPPDLGDCGFYGVSPYMKTLNPATFWNQDTYQIISAGRDGIFNTSTAPWSPGTFSPGGADDMTNFTEGFLAQR